MTKTTEDEVQMDFSKPRMIALRFMYFIVGVGALLVAKVQLPLSNDAFLVLVLGLLAAIIISYPIQLRMVYSVAYRRKELGPQAMIGLEGSALEDLAPGGKVRVRGEIWKARAASGSIGKGETIAVVSVGEGLLLVVDRPPKGS